MKLPRLQSNLKRKHKRPLIRKKETRTKRKFNHRTTKRKSRPHRHLLRRPLLNLLPLKVPNLCPRLQNRKLLETPRRSHPNLKGNPRRSAKSALVPDVAKRTQTRWCTAQRNR